MHYRFRLGSVVCAVIVVLVLAVSICAAETICVKPGGSDTNDGRSWATAKATVQAAIDAASYGDEVWVAKGTYIGCITTKSGVALLGGFSGHGRLNKAGRNADKNVTVLDGNAEGSVVTVPSGADRNTIIDGFTIRNGCGTYVNGYPCGGGIFSVDASPTISNNLITRNIVGIEDRLDGCGAGVFCRGGEPTIQRNVIEYNDAEWYHGALGGGVCCSGRATITGNIVRHNYASGGSGGGIVVLGEWAFVANNIIIGNGAHYDGGGILYGAGDGAIVDNVIDGNEADYGGGAISWYGGYGVIANNTIVGNNGTDGGSVLLWSGCTVANNIVAFGTSGIAYGGEFQTARLLNNCVFGNECDGTPMDYVWMDPGDTDINVDPGLKKISSGDYRLQQTSPCIDTGDDSVVGAGWLDIYGGLRTAGAHVDIGADEFGK